MHATPVHGLCTEVDTKLNTKYKQKGAATTQGINKFQEPPLQKIDNDGEDHSYKEFRNKCFNLAMSMEYDWTYHCTAIAIPLPRLKRMQNLFIMYFFIHRIRGNVQNHICLPSILHFSEPPLQELQTQAFWEASLLLAF